MDYILMHKTTPVVELEIDEETAAISKIGEIFSIPHIPIGINFKDNRLNRGSLNEWWHGRSIPASRQNIQEALKNLGVSTTNKLITQSFGLSLSDQYWVNPVNNPLEWEKINFFDNDFSDDVGNILLGSVVKEGKINLISPDNTSDGWLKKKWTIIDGNRALIKGGSGTTQQEPYNEMLACAVMRRLGIPHVPYTLIMIDEYPYSVCEDFITRDTELISAWYIINTQKILNHISLHRHYINCCTDLSIPNITDAMNYMLTLDYIIVNEDRHLNNFGVIRNANSLKWLCPAPVYDSGTSMWCNTPTTMIKANVSNSSKPFRQHHSEQIKLVTSFEWLDFTALKGIDEEFYDILGSTEFIDAVRRDTLCKSLRMRIQMLSDYVTSQEKTYYSGYNDFKIFEGNGEDIER